MKDHPILFQGDMVRAIMTCSKCGTITLKIECPKCGSKKRRKFETRRIIPGEIHINPTQTSWHWHKPRGGYMERHDERGNDRVFRNILGDASPYGVPGELLWVRENTRTVCYDRGPDFAYGEFCIEYLADKQLVKCPEELHDWWRHQWHIRPGIPLPSIFMPKDICRNWLKVLAGGVERVQEITVRDVVAEGVQIPATDTGILLRVSGKYPPSDYWPKGTIVKGVIQDDDAVLIAHFASLWDSINAKPKPRYAKKEIIYYESYPWEAGTKTGEYRDKPWRIHGNPFVFKTTFERYDK